MNTAEAIVAIDAFRLNDFTLTLRSEGRASLHSANDAGLLSNANEMIEARFLSLIVY